MHKILFAFFLTVYSTIQINGQSAIKLKPRAGLYFGGVSYSNEKMGTGYYYFKKDSSFIFLSTTFNPKVPPNGNVKNSFTDTLAGYGKGRWFIKDSFFIVQFEPVINYNLQNDDVLYHSFLKYPYDSILIKIQLQNKIEQNPVTAAITIKDLSLFAVTDTLGFGIIKMPFNYKEYRLTISNPEFHDKTIILNPDNNVHEIRVSLSKKDMPYINLVSPFNFSSKILLNEKKEMTLSYFKKETGGVEKLIQIINNGIKKMPEQKFFLDKIINEVKGL